MKRLTAAMFLMASLLGAQTASAVDFNVRIINLSNGIYYTPFLVAAHPAGTSIFTVGQPASANLQAMAEGGDISGLVTDLQGLGATIAENPAGGLLAPAASTDVDINTDGTSNELLTIVAMLLPTNDAFAGLNAVQIPTTPGTYVFDVPAYDAGTEANDEMITGGGAPGAAGIPADPGGLGGTGGTAIIHAPHVKHIRAIDISPKMIEIVNAKAEAAGVENVEFEVQTIEDLDAPDGSFDAILSLSILHLVKDKDAVLEKVFRLLKPGGVFISSTICISDMAILIPYVIPIMQFFGQAPFVAFFNREELLANITATGFEIDYDWRPGKRKAVFVVAKKAG